MPFTFGIFQGNVHTIFGFSAYFCSQLKSLYVTDGRVLDGLINKIKFLNHDFFYLYAVQIFVLTH